MHKLSEISQKIISGNSSAFLYTSSYFNKNAVSYLLHEPKEIITINSLKEVNKKFKKLDLLVEKKNFILSLIRYEAGYLFEERLHKYLNNHNCLIKFICFDKSNIELIPSAEILFENFDQDFKVNDFSLNESKEEYVEKINKIKNYIKEGDTYQVNYTLKGKFNFSGSINSFFQNLIFNQSTQYSALINDGNNFIISISPELFFSTEGNIIKSRPMNGTTKRGINLSNDISHKEELKNSKKDKAENVMIVDLLRNDIGKISEINSVQVKSIYDIEKYETIYQLTSEIYGMLKSDIYSEIIKNLFPCGSITGAPKIRTMRIIKELEKEERGMYTGAIGIINNDKSVFNVAIRTIVLDKKTFKGEIGLGSGIVWDSIGEDEFAEVKLKSNFLLNPDKYFEIFETMLLQNGKIFLLNEHITRLRKAADYFLFKFDEEKIISVLEQEIINYKSDLDSKVKLVLRKDGSFNFIVTKEDPIESRRLLISKNKINSKNKFQYFKTTNRKLYNEEYSLCKVKNYFDVIFFNEKNELAEGAISNIFLFSEGKWKTPLITCGILDGIYRSKFIVEKNVVEEVLTLKDILKSEKLTLTNSVKKDVEIFEIYEDEKLIWCKS